ncbi:MAG: hypothetical protein A2Z83_07405 [Omnitrophica bacterium GWA2_52_8]|nr:MAG: hypothetical protein A2Z83_07405 [Omnitrophica bacterium GWA2_52_8]
MPDLSSADGKRLLQLARQALEAYLKTGDHLEFIPQNDSFTAHCGCFVTLRSGDQLRGCIGTFDCGKPLYENVIRMAIAAGTQDMRFKPLRPEELAHIHIELSVLGELEKVEQLEAIEVGKHGIVVRCKNKNGTFLPEVAVEQGWQREEFLLRCAREKAGMSEKECAEAEVYRYTVRKFSEDA